MFRRTIRLNDEPASQPVEKFGERGLFDFLRFLTVYSEAIPPLAPHSWGVNQLDFEVGPNLFVLNGKAKTSIGPRHDPNRKITPTVLQAATHQPPRFGDD